MSATELHVTLAPPAGDEAAHPVIAAEVIGPAVGDVRSMPMVAGETQVLAVPPGIYLVRAASAVGDFVGATVEVGEGEAQRVTLQLPASADPGLPDRWGLEAAGGAAWARLYEAGQPVPWRSGPDSTDLPARWTVDYDGTNARCAVQVGGPSSAWRTVALPPERHAVLTLAPVPGRGDFDDGLRVEVCSDYPQAAAMLDYLAAGQVGQARVVAVDVADVAMRLFREKMASPEGAAVAGYVLLRMRQTDRIGDWADNFANWYEWLPDAQVIHAWQLLHRPRVPDITLVRSRLLRAAEREMPCYTEGLRLLFEGLRVLAGSAPDDAEVAEALSRVKRYADACDWSATMTTYWSHSPGEPSLERRTGWPPAETEHVVRLGEPAVAQ